jgi:hypothetical protein
MKPGQVRKAGRGLLLAVDRATHARVQELSLRASHHRLHRVASGCSAVTTQSPTSPTFRWVNNLIGFYGAADLVGFSDFLELQRV